MDNISKTTDVSRFPEIDYSLPPMDKIFIDSVECQREEMKNSNNAKKANTKMRFYIPASKRAIDPSELFFQLNVAARTSGDAELGDADKESIRLADGGVHSLFREMIIRDGRGNIVEKIENYNLVTKILQDTMLTKEVKNNLLNVEGVYSDYDLRNSVHTKTTLTGDTIALTAANNRLTGVNTTFLTEVLPGDVVYFNGGSFTVVTVDSATQLTVQDVDADSAATAIVARRDYIEGIRTVDSPYKKHHHDRLFEEKGAVYCFQPYASGFLSQQKYLHLDHFGGLEFEFTLDSNAIIFDDTNTGNTANIFVKQGYVHYTALELSPIVEASLAKAYMRGLSMSYPVFHIVSRTQNAGREINQEYQESLAILKMVKVVSRESGFDTSANPSFAFEDLTAADRLYFEINKQRFTEYGNDEILPQVVYMNNRIGKNLMGDYKHATLSYNDFKDGSKGALIFNTQNYKDGNYTGVNTNRATLRLKISGGSATVGALQPRLNSVARQIDVIFMHEQYLMLKDGEPVVVRS